MGKGEKGGGKVGVRKGEGELRRGGGRGGGSRGRGRRGGKWLRLQGRAQGVGHLGVSGQRSGHTRSVLSGRSGQVLVVGIQGQALVEGQALVVCIQGQALVEGQVRS